MPELPEVESVARTVRPLLLGRQILCCRVIHPIAISTDSPVVFARRAVGQRVRGVERRGKYLLLRLDRGWLVLHFRLDGRLIWFDTRRVSGHIDVALEFRRSALGFVDRRHFGRVQWVRKPEDVPGIAKLGVDPLSSRFTPGWLADTLSASRRPLKLFLLDQSRIAGLGNIYASEALWRARLDPRRPASRLAAAEVRRLHKAVVGILRAALQCCLSPAPDLRDPDWWFTGLDRILRVYDREGRPCPRCRKLVRRMSQGGRSTYYCPRCQR